MVRRQIAKGAAWMLLFRLAEKSLGLVSTIVLARILVPADFGLVAMAMSIIALVELASSFSFETVLIQKEHPERVHYDTAWTLNVLFGLGCAAAMLALAVPASIFYAEPRLVAAIAVIALGWAVQGAENVGTVEFRRRMDFRSEFRFLAVKKVAGFAVTIACALALRNYWALVAGMLAGRLTGVAASYAMAPYRPRLSLAARGEMFRFSSWLLVANVVNFAENRFAHFFVGRTLGPEPLGVFTLGSDLAAMATTELSAPINRAAFPGYARVADSLAQLRREATVTIGMIGLLTVPLTLGLGALSEPLVALVMGERWLPVVPVLNVLVLGACLRAVMSNFHSVFMALGRPHLTPVLEACRVAAMIPLTLLLAASQGLHGVALAQLASIAAGFVASSIVLVRVLALRWTRFAAQLARPVLAAGAMVGAIALARQALRGAGHDGAALQLAAGIAVGAVSYVGALVALWWVCGRPDGAESAVLRWAAARLGWFQVPPAARDADA